MNAYDILSLALIGSAALKGRRRGGAVEAYRLLRWLVGLLAGCGLYSLASRFLSGVFPDLTGFSGFLVGFGGAFLVVRSAKVRMIRFLEKRFPEETATRAGLIAGALRGAVIVVSLTSTAFVAPLFPWQETITQTSVTGKAVGIFFEAPAD